MPSTPTSDPLVPTGTPPLPTTGQPAPTFDEILPSANDERKVFKGVSWEFYRRLGEVLAVRPRIRVAYDGKDIEIMTVGPFHDSLAELASELAKIVASELRIPALPMRSTTWVRPELQRAVEADQSFYLVPGKLAAAIAARARRSNDVADYPNPDLAIEVDISPPQVDRPTIYAALRVAEIWRLTEKGVHIERLTPDGTYIAVPASVFLRIRVEEVARWIFEEDSSDLDQWRQRLRDWVRAELIARPAD